MKVLFLTNVPSPYRVDFFNELGKYCDLTVLFEKSTSDERDESWKKYRFEHFQGVLLKGVSIDTDSAICFEVTKYLKPGFYDHIIVSNFLSPTGMIAITHMRQRKMEYWLESDGGFAKDGKGLKEKLKTHFIRGAKGYFSTAVEHDRYYLQYGAEAEKLHRFPFTSLRQADVLEKPVEASEKRELREKLNMKEEKIVVSVGQFVYRKGYDVLFNALAKSDANLGCYIIGGVPTEEYLSQLQSLGLKNVHFVGFQLKQQLAEYYKAADVFVLPTREDIWGLVVNEAMANGLPVVTTDRCIAGLAMVEPKKNGIIVPVENADALKNALEKLLYQVNLEEYSARSVETAREYTIERMAQVHVQILNPSGK